ncbi:MAG: phage antirepressor KilAC domain-containing protein, partial [Roseburia sp.]|nr:phage antirepressor KilAC domain-containing protein [Roseburia sp.]
MSEMKAIPFEGMNNQIEVFNHPEFGDVRTLLIEGEPWFVGKDVAEILQYRNTKDAILAHVREEDKRILQRSEITTFDIPTRGLTIINESGLYDLIISSKLPSARKFRHWVTSEVLPSIRKHGAYLTAEKLHEVLSEPRNLATLLNTLADEQAKSKRLEEENLALSEENAVLSEKASYCDRILDTKNAVPVTQIAKDYGMSAMR